MSQRFTGAELVRAVLKGDLEKRVSQEPVSIDGMVKAADEKSDAILFAVGTSCQSWTEVPEAMIERAEHLTTVPCRDHEHPFVTLVLKNPPAENREATVFASLLRAGGTRSEVKALEDLVSELTGAGPGPTGFLMSGDPCGAFKRCCARGVPYCCERVERWCR